MEERRLEVAPSELINVIGSAMAKDLESAGVDEEDAMGILKFAAAAVIKAIRHLAGIEMIDAETLKLFDVDPEEVEAYLQDQEGLIEERKGRMS